MGTSSIVAYVAIFLMLASLAMVGAYAFAPASPLRAASLRYLNDLDKQTRALFLKITPLRIAVIQATVVLGGAATALLFDPRVLVIAILAIPAPSFAFKVLRAKRVKVIEVQLAGWLDILANMLCVSGSLADALAGSAALTGGPLGQELDLTLKEIKVGAPLPLAGRAMAERVNSPLFSGVMTLLMIGRNTGGELPTLLNETAATLRERMRLEGVVRRHTAMGRAQILVLALAPWAIIVMFRQAEPDFFDPLLEAGLLGQILMTAAFLIWLISILMARKILKVEI